MFSSISIFGASQTQSVPAENAAEPKRQEEKQTCVPTTLRAIQTADLGAEFQLFGSEVTFVVVVGVVEKLVQQGVGLEFVLNDATGRVSVKHFSNDRKTLELMEGMYVEVVAAVRTQPTLHLSAQWMHGVKSADEVSYHMIAAAHAALKLQRGHIDAPTPVKKRVAETPAMESQFASPPKEPKPPQAVLEAAKPDAAIDVRSVILGLLRNTEDAMGLSIAKMLTHSPSLDAPGIRRVLDELVSDGEAYATIDDDHFALL